MSSKNASKNAIQIETGVCANAVIVSVHLDRNFDENLPTLRIGANGRTQKFAML